MMENDEVESCKFCSIPYEDSVAKCPVCKEEVCEKHKFSHGCPQVPISDWEKVEDSTETYEDERENEEIDEYNDKVEKDNVKIDEENKRRNKKIVIGSVIMVFAVSILIIGANGFNFDVNNVPTGFVDYAENAEIIKDADLAVQCESWNIQGQAITTKYDGIDIDYWSQEDYDNAKQLETLVSENCIETKEDILLKLDLCTTNWINLNHLIWYEMDENIINSLSEEMEQAYNDTYKQFFREKCHVILDAVLEQQSVIDWKIQNATDNWDKVVD